MFYPATNTLGLTVGGSEKMRIDNLGNVGIGTTNPLYQLQLSTDSAAKPTTNTWTVPSDARLKTNVTAFSDGLSVISQINPVRYTLNGLAGTPAGAQGIGVIAQDILQVAPYTVSTYSAKLNPDDLATTQLYSFNSGDLTFVMINAIKELNTDVRQIQAAGGVLTVIPGTDAQCVTGDTKLRRRRRKDGLTEVENEIAALADGDFGDSRNQPASESGLVTPGGSIANGTSASSASDDLVDNLMKPAEGIEPSSQRMTSPDSLQAAGWCQVYHDDAYVYDEIEIKDVEKGDEIASLDERTGKVIYSRVNALMDMGVQEVFELRTASGRTIRTTGNHPYLVRKI